MNKKEALDCLNNCVLFELNFNPTKMVKALILNDTEILDDYRKKHAELISKKQMYIDQVNNAKDDQEIDKILGSVDC
jgi:hypothetical protein